MKLSAIKADLSVSVSELKKNPTGVIRQANGRVVAVLNHNKPQAYLVPAELFEDLELAALVRQRMDSNQPPIQIKLSDL